MRSAHRRVRRPVPPPGIPSRLSRRWTVPLTISALWALICRIEHDLQAYAPSQTAREDIILGLVEAMSNAHSGSQHAQSGQRIVVGLDVSRRSVRLVIKDPGQGFPFRQRPVTLVQAEREEGRGLFLIERVMDRVTWSESGNAIRMERHWHCDRP
ncbi:MAG: ATP-binding protein [Candidatus Sericytochromatia bacterium]|nr:ATP-binding protein [Candidatus Sericytochromatia bacterium]